MSLAGILPGMAPDRDSAPDERAPEVLERLRQAYPDAGIALNFSNPLECVIAVVLSAQSTDAKINEVTETLFVKYKKPEDYLAVAEDELKEDLKPTGFFNQKTKAVRGISAALLEKFDGEVPQSIAELIMLPGVARKTANIVQGNCWPEAVEKDPDAGIAVDTHVGRVAVRLGLTTWGSKEAVKIEQDLMARYPKEDWPKIPDTFIFHGRLTCDARQPRCEDCPVEPLCPSSQEAGLPDLYRAPKKSTVRKKTRAKRTTGKKTSVKKSNRKPRGRT
ncbi:MAG: endonuclease III domain-containing protein [Actinomycetota bacterium]